MMIGEYFTKIRKARESAYVAVAPDGRTYTFPTEQRRGLLDYITGTVGNIYDGISFMARNTKPQKGHMAKRKAGSNWVKQGKHTSKNNKGGKRGE